MPSLFNPYSPSQFYLSQQKLPDPGGGTDAAFTIPAGYTYELLSLSFIFTTLATAGDRYIYVSLENATLDSLFRTSIPTPVALNTTARVSVGPGFTPRIPVPPIFAPELSWPVGLLMIGDNILTIRIQGIKPSDAITDIFLIAKQWFST